MNWLRKEVRLTSSIENSNMTSFKRFEYTPVVKYEYIVWAVPIVRTTIFGVRDVCTGLCGMVHRTLTYFHYSMIILSVCDTSSKTFTITVVQHIYYHK